MVDPYDVRSSDPPQEVLAAAERLIAALDFTAARRLLRGALERPDLHADPARLRIAQRCTLATYKDPELRVLVRLDRAMKLLRDHCGLEGDPDQETLGLAGAIEKQRWLATGDRSRLEMSLEWYGRAAAQPWSASEGDQGSTTVNAAFVAEHLAALGARAGAESDGAWRARADAHRRTVVERLDGPVEQLFAAGLRREDYWPLVTLAEARLGFGEIGAARRLVEAAARLEGVPEFHREATVRQLAALARCMAPERLGGSEPPAVVREVVGALVRRPGTAVPAAPAEAAADAARVAAALRALELGRVGLALSGGGFRASFFHVGVLARLAELDLLRHVHVLSCVSGGSILGASYYLLLQRMLSAKPDAALTRDDYVALVRDLAVTFLRGVRKNIRTRVFVGLLRTLRMALPGQSRTERLAELYDRHLYDPIRRRGGAAPGRTKLRDLLVHPPDEDPAAFRPKLANWRRAAKVPMLILNASTLNTGHTWQFTAAFMGEPWSDPAQSVDANERLRRFYLDGRDAPPPKYRDFPLSRAVAASSCVPGLFPPLVLDGLYERRSVRLVDGGVHDNQGIAGLLEQDCRTVLVSDASGQMSADRRPKKRRLKVLSRTMSVLQSRVRAVQHQELVARKDAGLLGAPMFIHLKSGLAAPSVSWIRAERSGQAGDPRGEADGDPATPYGVRRELQEKLAGIRTDLDSFSNVEAWALMADGYLQTREALPADVARAAGEPPPPPCTWPFLRIQRLLAAGDDRPRARQELARQLEIARHLPFKCWRRSRWMMAAGFAFIAAWIAPGVALTWLAAARGGLWPALGVAVVLLVVLATAFARFHLAFLDPLFLRHGTLRRLHALDRAAAPSPAPKQDLGPSPA